MGKIGRHIERLRASGSRCSSKCFRPTVLSKNSADVLTSEEPVSEVHEAWVFLNGHDTDYRLSRVEKAALWNINENRSGVPQV